MKIFTTSFLLAFVLSILAGELKAQAPNMPGVITGPRYGVCGLSYVYSIKPVFRATSYNWTITGGTLISGQGDTAVIVSFPVSTSTYYVSVYASNSSGNSNTRSIDVHGKPAKAKDIVSTPFDWCAGQVGVQFFADITPLTGIYSLDWNWTPVGAAGNPQGASSNLFTLDWYQQTNNAVVRMFASNACGTQIKYYTTTVSCREAGYSVDESTEIFDVSVFPNPATDVFTLRFHSFEAASYDLRIVNLTGQVVLSEKISAAEGSNQHVVDLSGYSKGIYSVMLNGNSTTEVKRVSIQ